MEGEGSDPLSEPRLRGGRGRRLLPIGVGVAVVGGAVALFALRADRHVKSARDAEVRLAHADLVRCLVGALDADEPPAVRFRRVQLTAMGLEEASRRGPSNEPWPADCAPLAFRLGNALDAAHRAAAGGGDLAGASRCLAAALQARDAVLADLSEPVAALFERAAAEHVETTASQYPLPPEPARPATSRSFAGVSPLVAEAVAWNAIRTEPHPTPHPVLVIDAPDAPPRLCRLDAHPSCKPLPKELAPLAGHLALLGTADGAPLLFAGRRGVDGIYRSDTGERLGALYAYGAYVSGAGDATVLGWDDAAQALTLLQAPAGKLATVAHPDWTKSGTGNAYYATNVLWDTIFQKKVLGDDGAVHVLARRTEAPSAPPVDIGTIDQLGLIEGGSQERQHVDGCRSEAATFARFKGTSDEFLSVRPNGGSWSAPVLVTGKGGTLSCHGLAAAVVHASLEGAGPDERFTLDLERADCTGVACGLQIGKIAGVPGLAPHQRRFDAIALGGQVLVLWQAGQRGGVRMRLAVAGSLAKARDRVVYDDRSEPGEIRVQSSLLGVRALPFGDRALVLLHTTRGLFALTIDPDGVVTPLGAE